MGARPHPTQKVSHPRIIQHMPIIMTRKMAGKCQISTMTRVPMPVCMEAVVTKTIYTTDYEGMPIRAKSQIKVAMKQRVTVMDNKMPYNYHELKKKIFFLRSKIFFIIALV